MTQPAGAQSPTPRTEKLLYVMHCQQIAPSKWFQAMTDHAKEIERELSAANAALAEAQRGAARYRWLNAQDNFMIYIEFPNRERGNVRLKCGEPLDIWIDERIKQDAMSSTGEGSGG